MTRPKVWCLISSVTLAVYGTSAWAAGPSDTGMAVQVAGDLGTSAANTIATTAASHAPAPGFQPAPMPNQDVDAPQYAGTGRGPVLTPALFSQKTEFEGNGFASGSDPEHGLDKRRTPAAGLNWSVPVK